MVPSCAVSPARVWTLPGRAGPTYAKARIQVRENKVIVNFVD